MPEIMPQMTSTDIPGLNAFNNKSLYASGSRVEFYFLGLPQEPFGTWDEGFPYIRLSLRRATGDFSLNGNQALEHSHIHQIDG